MEQFQSPYGMRTLVASNQPDMPALDTLRGQGQEVAFNKYATNDGNRQINASNKQDMMNQISAIRRNAQEAGGLKHAHIDAGAQERWADFKAAYKDTNPKSFQVFGEVMSDSLN